MTTRATSSNDYPWDSLHTPDKSGEFNARLVSFDINPERRRVFWAKNWSANPAILVEYDSNVGRRTSLPSFENIEVADYKDDNCLSVELLDHSMQDIFLKVGLDIIASLQTVPPKACWKACLLRLERWSSFLKPSRSRLSPEQQKGLIAELIMLKNVVLAALAPHDALEGWTGPDSGPRDFAYGQTFIEVKSKRSAANPRIVISSEDQLNTSDSEQLFLFVVELNSAPINDEDSFTVTDVVKEARQMFESPLHRATLDTKLGNVGYFDEDDYSETRWTLGRTSYYEVREDFPRIDSASCRPGVSKVTYQVDLDYCDGYLVDRDTIIEALEN